MLANVVLFMHYAKKWSSKHVAVIVLISAKSKSNLGNALRQWMVGKLEIILDISLAQLVVLLPDRSVVVNWISFTVCHKLP